MLCDCPYAVSVYTGQPQVLEQIDALEEQLFSKEDSWSGGIKQEAGKRRTVIIYAQDANGKVLGYLIGSLHSINVHIAKVAVSTEYRRQGIAQALVKECLRHARSAGKALTCTLHVSISNAPALGLYRKLGYSLDALLKDYYAPGKDAYKMICDLVMVDLLGPATH